MDNAFIGFQTKGGCKGITAVTEDDLVISAAVGVGGKNLSADVKTIQEALNRVPTNQGGPTPRLAVDGIAGKLTVEAISRFQRRNVGFSDGRVDTNNVTIAKLRTFNGESNPNINQTPVAPALPAKTVGAKKPSVVKAPKKPKPPDGIDIEGMRLVTGLLKEAQRWIFIADTVAGRAQNHLLGSANTVFKEAARKSFGDCDKFFKLKGLSKSNALAALTFIRSIFQKMRTCIGLQVRLDVDPKSPLGFFQVDPTDNNVLDPPDAIMFTEFGGFSKRDKNGKPGVIPDSGELRSDSIFVATKFILAQEVLLGNSKILADSTTATMIHELAHFVGPGRKSPNRLDDHAQRDVEQAKFDNLVHFLALRNADTYALFCAHVTPNVQLSA